MEGGFYGKIPEAAIGYSIDEEGSGYRSEISVET